MTLYSRREILRPVLNYLQTPLYLVPVDIPHLTRGDDRPQSRLMMSICELNHNILTRDIRELSIAMN